MFSAPGNTAWHTLGMLEDHEDKIEAVAARLKAAREALGYSKREFAERAGMSEQGYGAYENCKRPLSLEAAKRLRKRYNLSLEFIYFGKIEDLPTRISSALPPNPSVSSSQKSSDIPD